MSVSLPTTGSRFIGNLSWFFEPIVVAQSLAIAGVAASAATSQYGELTGFALTLLTLPSFIQIVRISLVAVCTTAFLPLGIEYAAAGAMLSSVFGELASLLYLFVAFKYKKKIRIRKRFFQSLKAGRLSAIITPVFLIYAPLMADTLLTDKRTLYPLLAVTPVVPIIAVSSVLRGYFQGKQNMRPLAVSQVLDIVIARFIGGEGVGLYMMAAPTFFLAVTLTQFGLPVAISKLVAEAEARRDHRKTKQILVMSLAITGTKATLLSHFFRETCHAWTMYAHILLYMIKGCLRRQGTLEMTKQTFLKGTLILIAAGLITRMLGFINRFHR
ncbi:hypothetical protein DT075_16350 [Bacillus licheniformis]|nr:hypothetical protein DT075_16350 [Bacillus licheniformis]